MSSRGSVLVEEFDDSLVDGVRAFQVPEVRGVLDPDQITVRDRVGHLGNQVPSSANAIARQGTVIRLSASRRSPVFVTQAWPSAESWSPLSSKISSQVAAAASSLSVAGESISRTDRVAR